MQWGTYLGILELNLALTIGIIGTSFGGIDGLLSFMLYYFLVFLGLVFEILGFARVFEVIIGPSSSTYTEGEVKQGVV